MRKWIVLFTTGIVLFAGCDNSKKPSKANFKQAINAYLEKNGRVCIPMAQKFPIDVAESNLNDHYGAASELTALEKACLVRSFRTMAEIKGMLDALRGPSKPQAVKRYELTDQGKKYFQQYPTLFGQAEGFCYGQERVGSIVKWDEPTTQGEYSATSVTYTYKIGELASWAQLPEIQRAFPIIKTTIDQANSDQVAGLHLTNSGWEVNGF